MPTSAHSETSDVPESDLYADYVDERCVASVFDTYTA